MKDTTNKEINISHNLSNKYNLRSEKQDIKNNSLSFKVFKRRNRDSFAA